MTRWVERKEKVLHFNNYVIWHTKNSSSIDSFNTRLYPSCRIKLPKYPLCSNVAFQDLEDEYGAEFIEDALARYIVQHNDPDATPAQIKARALDIDLSTDGLPVYHRVNFWLGHSKHHPLSSNEYNVVVAKPSQKKYLRPTGAWTF